MTVQDLYERFCLTFPSSLSCPWDNDGLMLCPDPTRTVRRVLVTLDVTPAAVTQAIDAGADVIISHHPLLFHPITSLTHGTPTGDKLLRLTGAGISVFSFHTRADAAAGGVSDLLADALGLANRATVGEEGILRIGFLPAYLGAPELAERIRVALSCPAVTFCDAGRPIRTLAVCGGEGKDMVDAARNSGADALLAGRIGYHAMIDGADAGFSLFEAGHWYSEFAIVGYFADLVRRACGAEVITHRQPPVSLSH